MQTAEDLFIKQKIIDRLQKRNYEPTWWLGGKIGEPESVVLYICQVLEKENLVELKHILTDSYNVTFVYLLTPEEIYAKVNNGK